jgi:hypothetical protein
MVPSDRAVASVLELQLPTFVAIETTGSLADDH